MSQPLGDHVLDRREPWSSPPVAHGLSGSVSLGHFFLRCGIRLQGFSFEGIVVYGRIWIKRLEGVWAAVQQGLPVGSPERNLYGAWVRILERLSAGHHPAKWAIRPALKREMAQPRHAGVGPKLTGILGWVDLKMR